MNQNGDNTICVLMICGQKMNHFTVTNIRFTAPLTRPSKTKFATIKWYNICLQVIQSQTCYPLSITTWTYFFRINPEPITVQLSIRKQKRSTKGCSKLKISVDITSSGREYCYSGREISWYGSWKRHVCRKGKCAADRLCRSTGVDPSRKQSCCYQSRFYLKLSGIHLTKMVFKILFIDWQHVIDISIYKLELRCLLFLSSREKKDCMVCSSYEYRNM